MCSAVSTGLELIEVNAAWRLLAQPIKIYDVRNECALAANKLATK